MQYLAKGMFFLICFFIFGLQASNAGVRCFSGPYDHRFDIERERNVRSAPAITSSAPNEQFTWCATRGDFFNAVTNVAWNQHVCSAGQGGSFQLNVLLTDQPPRPKIVGRGSSSCPIRLF